MPTTKTRINVTLSDEMVSALEHLSRRDQVPSATKASELLRLALEIEEDRSFDALVSKRELKNPKLISHQEAWK